MHSPFWLLTAGIAQCAIPAGSDYRLRDCIVQFFGLAITVPHKCAKQSWRIVPGQKCTFLERKAEPSFLGLRNAISVKVESRPRLDKLANGKLKANVNANAWQY